MAPSCGISNWQAHYPRNFLRRNKIIIGLVIGTLVVEANIKSGLLLAARLAMDRTGMYLPCRVPLLALRVMVVTNL
jgi:hypothetical protein